MPEIRKVKNVRIVKERGVDWTTYRTPHGRSSFHAAKQRIELDCDFSILIDMDALVRRLGNKAAFSKGGKSQLAGGIIKLICTGRRVVKDERAPVHIPEGYIAEKPDVQAAVRRLGETT